MKHFQRASLTKTFTDSPVVFPGTELMTVMILSEAEHGVGREGEGQRRVLDRRRPRVDVVDHLTNERESAETGEKCIF